jgi:hypothetical protein
VAKCYVVVYGFDFDDRQLKNQSDTQISVTVTRLSKFKLREQADLNSIVAFRVAATMAALHLLAK